MRAADAKRCGTPAARGAGRRGCGGRRRGVREADAEGCGRPTPRGAAVGVGAILVPEIPRVEVRDPSRPLWRARPVAQRSSAPPERPHISGPYAVLPPATQRNTAPAERPHLSGPYAVLHPVTQRNVVIGRNLRDMPCSGSGPTHPTIHHPMCAGHPGDRPGPRPPNPRNMPWSTSRPTYPTFRRPTQDGRARGADAGASRCVENRSTGVLRQDPEQKGYAPRSGAERSCAEIRSREGVSR